MEIGDIVRIRPRLSSGREYGGVFFADAMNYYRGKQATITKTWNDGTRFCIDIDNGAYTWSKSMFVQDKEYTSTNIEDVKEPKEENVEEDNIIEKILNNQRDAFTKILNEQNKKYEEMFNRTESAYQDILSNQAEKQKETFNNMSSAVEELTKKIDKRTLYDDTMLDIAKKKVEDISIEDLVKDINKKVDSHIKKTYGALPTQKVEINTGSVVKNMTGIFHKRFDEILKIVQRNVPLMLTGPAGAGKNYTLEQVAKALDLDFYFTNAVTQEYKLTGFIDANGVYQETQFYKAFKDGGLFFLDEIDASCPEALIVLNAAIANGYFDFPCGRINCHENFRVVAAGNTYGTGADMVYVGRNVLDGATLDRFVVIDFDYDENVEKQLAYDNELYNFIVDLRKVINKNSLRYIVSMRATINATKLLETGMDKKSIIISTIIKNMQIDDLNIIADKLKSNEWATALKEIVNDRSK